MSLRHQILKWDLVFIKLFGLVGRVSIHPGTIAHISRFSLFLFSNRYWVVTVWHFEWARAEDGIVEAVRQLLLASIVGLDDRLLLNKVPQFSLLFSSDHVCSKHIFSLLIFRVLVHFQELWGIDIFASSLLVLDETSQCVSSDVVLEFLLLIGRRPSWLILAQVCYCVPNRLYRRPHRWGHGWFVGGVLAPEACARIQSYRFVFSGWYL